MAIGLASATFIGNLTRDPELKQVGELTIGEFSIAVSRKYKGEETVSYFDFVVFGALADIVGKYTKTGTRVGLVAEPRQERWTKDGKKSSRVRFNVSTMTILAGGKGEEDK